MRTLSPKVRDAELLAIANRQYGLLRRADLNAAGLYGSALSRRLASGRLTRLQPDVFAFGHTALRDEGWWLAALWSCGAGAALSHQTGGLIHRLPVPRQAVPHVTTTRDLRRRGVVVHRTRHLDPVDVVVRGPFQVTSLARTLVDLADVLPWAAYRDVADSLREVPVDAVRAAQRRSPNRTGAPLVTRLLAATEERTRSELERRFLRFVRRHGLPKPDGLNDIVAGHLADGVYRFDGSRRHRGLVVELDGRRHHDRRSAMRTDRLRDADYQLAGFLVLRLLWDDLQPDAAPATARRLRRLLGA